MIEPAFTITAFDPHAAGATTWRSVHACCRTLLAERAPDMPPSAHGIRDARRALPAAGSVRWWSAQAARTGAIVAVAVWWMPERPHVTAQAVFDLGVLPRFRRLGLGTRLLNAIVQQAAARGQTSLLTSSFDAIPAGAHFLARLAASPYAPPDRLERDGAGDGLWVVDLCPALLGREVGHANAARRLWQVDMARVRAHVEQRNVPL